MLVKTKEPDTYSKGSVQKFEEAKSTGYKWVNYRDILLKCRRFQHLSYLVLLGAKLLITNVHLLHQCLLDDYSPEASFRLSLFQMCFLLSYSVRLTLTVFGLVKFQSTTNQISQRKHVCNFLPYNPGNYLDDTYKYLFKLRIYYPISISHKTSLNSYLLLNIHPCTVYII